MPGKAVAPGDTASRGKPIVYLMVTEEGPLVTSSYYSALGAAEVCLMLSFCVILGASVVCPARR